VTFSRPNIGPVDALGRIARPNDQRGADRVYAPDPNIRFSGVDARNPSIIRQAAENDSRRVQAFFEGIGRLTEAADEVISARLDTSEAERIASDANAQKALRGMTPEGRQVFNSLRYNTRKQVAQDFAAVDAVNNYGSNLLLRFSKELPSLAKVDPSLTPEEQSQQFGLRRTALEADVAKESGILNLPAEVLKARMPQLNQYRAAAQQLQLNKIQSNREDELRGQQAAGVRGILGSLFSALIEVKKGNNPDGAEPAYKNAEVALKTLADQQGLTPSQTAQLTAQATGNTINEVINGTQTRQQAIATLNNMERLVNRKLFDNGMTLGQQAINDKGESLLSFLNTTKLRLIDDLDRDQQKESMAQLVQLYAETQGGMKPPASALQAYVGMVIRGEAKDPETAMRGLGLLSGLKEQEIQRGLTPTQEQLANAVVLQDELRNAPEGDRASMLTRAIQDGRVNVAQASSFRDMTGPSRRDSVIENTWRIMQTAAKEDIETAALEVTNEIISRGYIGANKAGNNVENAVAKQAFRTQLIGTVYEELKRRYPGQKQPTNEEMYQLIQQVIPGVKQRVLDRYKLPKQQEISRNDRAMVAVEESLQLLEQGQRGVNSFSSGLKEMYREKYGRAGSEKQLDQFRIEVMKSVKGKRPNGQIDPVYPNPQETIRKAAGKGQDRVTNKNTSYGATFASNVTKLLDANPTVKVQGALGIINQIAPRFGLPSLPNPYDPQAAKSAELTPDLISNAAIASLASRTVAPANRKQGAIYNAENSDVVARIMRDPATVMAGPLRPIPQVKPLQAVTSPARFTITNTHPFAFLVGLNEGTRKPDGSYTNAYSTHRDGNKGINRTNTGNYAADASRFRTPQQADRYWNARLSELLPQVTRRLEQLGLPRNTVGHQRLAFNALDLFVTSEAAGNDFIAKMGTIARNPTIEAIAKLRRDSFYLPDGRWDGFQDPATMLRTSLKRALVYDYFNPSGD
jgi:hypothetical protein